MKPLLQIVLVFALAIASLSFGSVLLKMGMERYGNLTASGISGLQALSRSPQLLGGAALMMVQFFGTLVLSKWGCDVSVVTPIMGLCYVGTAILGKWLLAEPVNGLRWVGISLVLLGVFCIVRSVVQTKTP